jgi:DNA invertase Pin-like site-specific DNA recombinase
MSDEILNEVEQVVKTEEKKNLRIAIYARVSPTKHILVEDKDKTLSKNEQINKAVHASILEAVDMCKKAAELDGNEVVKVYTDQYISGKKVKDLPAFNELMKDSENDVFDKIYVRRVDRLGRDMNDAMINVLTLAKNGIHTKSIEEHMDTSDPWGRSFVSFMAEKAEHDRIRIVENTRRGREAAKAAGVKFGVEKKEFDVDLLRKLRLMPKVDRPSWKKCESMFHCSRTLMIQRLKEKEYWDYDNQTVK